LALRAVVFDLDGTLVDSETPEFLAWQAVFREEGVELPHEVWVEAVGRPYGAFDPAAFLASQLARPLDRTLVRRRARRYFWRHFEPPRPRPGVGALLAACRAEGLGLAVATSARRRWARSVLFRLGYLEDFPVIVAHEDVRHPKPHPEPYRRALAALGVAPHEALAVEDSPRGAESAVAAGLPCLVVPTGVTQDLPFPAGVWRRASLDGLTLAEVAAHLESRVRDGSRTAPRRP
jgi:putative hydrolase of the HAD superfamily